MIEALSENLIYKYVEIIRAKKKAVEKMGNSGR